MGYHPWFEPLWRRLATVAVCVLWLAFEASYDALSLWFWLALAILILAVWDLLLSGKYGRSPSG
jgi:hypothetical protein